ncbi:MAG: hypothetical protein SGPRY_000056 [Prymnesium sp.]
MNCQVRCRCPFKRRAPKELILSRTPTSWLLTQSCYHLVSLMPQPPLATHTLALAQNIIRTYMCSLYSPDCCVILCEASGTWLLEARPADAAVAPNTLTCFGGKREPGEDPLECVLRECREELGWVPEDATRAIDLYVDGDLIAFFFMATAPPRSAELVLEPGR